MTIRTAQIDDRVQIEVEDTGIGMSETVRRRIFEPFFTTKGKQGNGLGLRIVQRTVQEHGGDIRVESQPERGSRFILTLPFAPAMDHPSAIPLFDLPRNTAHS